jgi:hypothetical protein
MTDTNIIPARISRTHPHLATIVMDPARWYDFERTFEDRPEVRILRLDDRTPDAWTVRVACASQEVRDLLEANW